MPILAFLVMHVSVCLLITTNCSAVFARFGWLNRFGAADRSVFLFERLFRLFEGVSCRLAEQLRATAGADACWLCRTMFLFASVFVCFVVADVLRTAVASACWSGELLFRI